MPGMRPSSAAAKSRILAAARARFAAAGYERATVRAIAAEAAIDPSMVIRYFGNKEQLFVLAAEPDLRLPDLAGLPRSELGTNLAAHFLDRWESDDGLKVLIRTAMTNPVAAARMESIFADQLATAVARVSGDPVDASRRAGLVASQVLGMALCRYVLRLPPVNAMAPDEIVAWIGPTLQRYVVGPR
jgi:AcrR family transcriptional regulator